MTDYMKVVGYLKEESRGRGDSFDEGMGNQN